jgi:hypothetical protein
MKATAEKLEPESNVDCVILDRDDSSHRSLIRSAIGRVMEFCRKYDTNNDPYILGKAVISDYLVKENRFLICVAMKDGEAVGHALAALVTPTWGETKRVQVLQHEYNDDFNLPLDFAKQLLASLEEWGKSCGAIEISSVVLNAKLARRLRMFYGFEDDMMQMKRKIEV